MGIAPVIAQTRSLYKEQQADIERFEVAIAQYLAGEIEEDVFRVIRLNNGVYGQRQGGTNQMVRIKLPAGTITPEQLELMAKLSTEYSRGWGHITTRQNIQFHFVELTKMPALLREIAEVGFFDPLNPPEGVSPGTRNRLGEMFGSRTRSNLW